MTAEFAFQPGLHGRRATYQDIIDLPHGVTGQIIDGVLYTQSRPARRHARSAGRILGLIDSEFDIGGPNGPGGWVILPEPELHFGDDVVVPDIAGWRRERLPDADGDPYFTTPPDWVCEVLSPSTASFDRIKKSRVYARAGIPWMWVVDPVAKGLEVFEFSTSSHPVNPVATYRLRDGWVGEEVVRAEPFTAMELDLKLLWMP